MDIFLTIKQAILGIITTIFLVVQPSSPVLSYPPPSLPSTIESSPSAKITPTVQPTQVVKTYPPPTQPSQATGNKPPSDDPVLCPVAKECGGGTTPLQRRECDQSICCGNPGNYIFYKDRSKSLCAQSQGGPQANQTIPSGPLDGFGMLQNAYNICVGVQKTKIDYCKFGCDNQLQSDKSACWFTFGSNPDTTKYGECLNGSGGAGEVYSICMNKCTNDYIQGTNKCVP